MTSLRWLLLPGLDGSGALFEPFLECLAGIDAVVVRYPDRLRADLDAHAHHAAAAIGDAQRCIVVAESFSGPVALRLQRRDPRVEAVVLVASFVRCPHPLLRVLPLSLIAAFARHLVSRPLLRMFCLGEHAPQERVDELRNAVQVLPADVMRTRLALLRSLDESAALLAVRVAVLHLRATRDRLVSASLRAAAPRGSFREIDIDGPHFLLQACPDACRRAIVEWATQFHSPLD
jgi:pimeloyl-ACP methyl ester carboxylesterase